MKEQGDEEALGHRSNTLVWCLAKGAQAARQASRPQAGAGATKQQRQQRKVFSGSHVQKQERIVGATEQQGSL
jgi:hypothetical protein